MKVTIDEGPGAPVVLARRFGRGATVMSIPVAEFTHTASEATLRRTTGHGSKP